MDNNRILAEIAVQILGFAVVFLVLRKFAWGQILGAIDKRRQTIEGAFADIERRKASLDALEKEYKARLEKIEQEARVKIQEAAAIGQTLARDIQERARQESQRLIDRAQGEIQQDLAKAKIAVRQEIVEVSRLMAEKVLKEKLDADGHKRLVDKFLVELERV